MQAKQVHTYPSILLVALLLASCANLPGRPDEVGGPTPRGSVGYQPPFLPITFAIDSAGEISVGVSGKLVTSLGTISYVAGVATKSDNTPLSARPMDVTQLIICQDLGDGQACEAFEIGSGRKMRIEMNGNFVTTVERNLVRIYASRGADIRVLDDGPPSDKHARGPARIDVETFDFEVYGSDTEVDLERSRSGIVADLAYDHVSGSLAPINGTEVSRVRLYSWIDYLNDRTDNDLPAEIDCEEANDWRNSFVAHELASYVLVSCVKTAEGDLGYLYIEPDTSARPTEYEVYSHIWVR